MNRQKIRRGAQRFATATALAAATVLMAANAAPPGAATTPESGRIALLLDASAEGLGPAWPIYCGVPFPKGALREPRHARVVDDAGAPVAAQVRIMARWPGTEFVRWLGVNFAGDPLGKYFLMFGPDVSRPDAVPGAPRLTVAREADNFVVNTGPARFVVPASGALVARAWLDRNRDGRFGEDELILRAAGGDLYVVDNHGRRGVVGLDPEPDDARLEPTLAEFDQQGAPVRATVRREGWYTDAQGARLARHITRLHFFAGQPFAHIEHTLVVTNDTQKTWFRDIGVRFAHTLPDAREVLFPAADPFAGEQDPEIVARLGAPFAGKTVRARLEDGDRGLFLFQEKAFYFSRMDPEKDCRFVIARETADRTETLHEGRFAGDWTDVRGAHGGLTVAMRRLWQQFPKEIAVEPGAVTVRFWSNRGGRELDFRLETLRQQWPKDWLNRDLHGDYGSAWTRLMEREIYNVSAHGLARTHDLLLFLHDGAAAHPQMARLAHVFSRPVLALADPKWFSAAEAMGPIHPRDPRRFPLEESFMETYFDNYMKIIRAWGDYGVLDYGSGPHIFYRVGSGETHPFNGRWYPYLNRYSGQIDYGFHVHLWRMYARSGQRKYLDYAEETNRHRMDICMIHWGPDANYATNHGYMIGKYPGAFSSSNTPVYWGNRPILHHQTGTDIRKLYWYYYLRDYRRAHDVAESYRELIKRLWDTNPKAGPFRGTRPFATLKNLGTVYQETGDPKVLEIGRAQLEFLVDLESPQGVTARLPTGMGKYGTKITGIERWYEATGDELAAKALRRAAQTYARTSFGNPPFSYYNAFARVLGQAFRLTDDPLYAKVLKRNMDVTVASYYDHEHKKWKDLFGVSAVVANNAYPMGDMAKGMTAVVRAGARVTPPLSVGRGRPALAVFRKAAGAEAVLDVRASCALTPRVFTLDGQPVDAAIEPFREKLYSLEKAEHPRFCHVRLPAAMPAGDYILDPGVETEPWEVFDADVENLVFYAPGGVTCIANSAPWRFAVPPGTPRFELYRTGYLELHAPDGTRVNLDPALDAWTPVEVQSAHAHGLWGFSGAPGTFVELRGTTPLLTTGPEKRYYTPETDKLPIARFALERDYRFAHEAEIFADPHARFVRGAVNADAAGQGLALHGRRALRIPRGAPRGDRRFEWFHAREGTLEFWFMPDWSSVHGNSNAFVLTSGRWFIRLHTEGRLQSMFHAAAEKGDVRDYAPMVFERARWTHLAWQWRESDGKTVVETFVNGRRQSVSEADGRTLTAPGEALLFGHHAYRSPASGSLNGVVDELRLSATRRYEGDFVPSRGRPLEPDAATLALFHFDGQLEGVSGAGEIVPAELLE